MDKKKYVNMAISSIERTGRKFDSFGSEIIIGYLKQIGAPNEDIPEIYRQIELHFKSKIKANLSSSRSSNVSSSGDGGSNSYKSDPNTQTDIKPRNPRKSVFSEIKKIDNEKPSLKKELKIFKCIFNLFS